MAKNQIPNLWVFGRTKQGLEPAIYYFFNWKLKLKDKNSQLKKKIDKALVIHKSKKYATYIHLRSYLNTID